MFFSQLLIYFRNLKMLENSVWEVEFNLPKGDTGLQFSDIALNMP